ncbi:MAG TPA: hypothetical protein VMT53_18350 [Terriglobales bacterium]|nr:hypothetical protein [Terriglobales bacterium]
MAGIKELPVWARILIGEPTSDARNAANPDRESDIAKEVPEILAERDKPFLSGDQLRRKIKQERRRCASLTLCGEA